eukprot:COSAG02_NODE_6173_length_3751_cov_2.355422_2_plen_369_part_00
MIQVPVVCSDAFGPLTKEDFPGMLGICLGFGRVDCQPIATRLDVPAPSDPLDLGFEMTDREMPTDYKLCAGVEKRKGLSFKGAVAWCQSLPTCKGMWFDSSGICIPMETWDRLSFAPPGPDEGRDIVGAFYSIHEARTPDGTATAEEFAYELVDRKLPEQKTVCAAGERGGLSFRDAVAWCKSLDDCTGMLFFDGTCIPMVSWDVDTIGGEEQLDGGLYEIHKTGALPLPSAKDIKHIEDTLIPKAERRVQQLKQEASEKLTVTVVAASGLKQNNQDAAVFVTDRHLFAAITAAEKDYPRGNRVTKQCKTVAVSTGDVPEWNEVLAFDELELVRADISHLAFSVSKSCHTTGVCYFRLHACVSSALLC